MERRKGYYLHIVRSDTSPQEVAEELLGVIDHELAEHGLEVEMISESDLTSELIDGVVLFKIIKREERKSGSKKQRG